MDTHILYMDKQLRPLEKAIQAGDVKSIRASREPLDHAHLVFALRRPNAHVLEAVVGNLLNQENGPQIIQDAINHARNIEQMRIVSRLVRAVEAHEEEFAHQAQHPEQQQQPRYAVYGR